MIYYLFWNVYYHYKSNSNVRKNINNLLTKLLIFLIDLIDYKIVNKDNVRDATTFSTERN